MEGEDDFVAADSGLEKVVGDAGFGPVFFDVDFAVEEAKVEGRAGDAFTVPPAEVEEEVVVGGFVGDEDAIGARFVAIEALGGIVF